MEKISKEQMELVFNRVIEILGNTPLVRGEDAYLVGGLKQAFTDLYAEKNESE